jgi:hypothetical protein
MVILQGFELEPGAIFGLQLETRVAAVVSADVPVQPRAVMLEERRIAGGPLAIRPALCVHLQQAQIDAKLDFLAPVLCFETAHDNLTRLIVPLVQEIRYVEIHGPNMAADARQVNGSAGEIRCL